MIKGPFKLPSIMQNYYMTLYQKNLESEHSIFGTGSLMHFLAINQFQVEF